MSLHIPKIKILTGEYAGRIAHVTWSDGQYLRVTPVDGPSLLSIELDFYDMKNEFEYIECEHESSGWCDFNGKCMYQLRSEKLRDGIDCELAL